MATPPFGAAFETDLKADTQGGKLHLSLGITVDPQFHCCISGNAVGVAKDPIPKLKVTPSQACTGSPVTANYASSTSPTSTLVTWQVDWGDGNVSSGAWPGAGSVNHPLGGYTIPAHYTITLTVTDQLGAYSSESVTHVALDCSEGIPVEVLGGCGASGPYHSSNGGFTWQNIGGGILEDVTIYDLKATWFSFGLDIQEVWAATDQGLYKGELNIVTQEASWEPITLPRPSEWWGDPTPYAICHSKYAEDEVYVLATGIGVGTWVYRTEDGGETWEEVQIFGNGWRGVGGGTTAPWDEQVYAIAFSNDGQYVYVGGSFTGIGGIAANYIARYNCDSDTWTAMGNLDSYVNTIAVSPSGRVYAAGSFASDGATTLNRVAYWSAVHGSWRPLANGANIGVNGTVYCSTVSAGGVFYIGGIFTTAGGENCDGCARWTGVWEGLDAGEGPDDIGIQWISGIGIDSNYNVYVAGSFDTVGGVTCSHVAQWHPDTGWSVMGTGIGDAANDCRGYDLLRIDSDNDVYVGGYFDTAGEVAAYGIARWDGREWHAVGEGVDSDVGSNGVFNIFLPNNTGPMYIGGEFDQNQPGTKTFNSIAVWSGESWRDGAWFEMDGGVTGGDGRVYAVAAHGARVFVGGNFTHAGTTASLNIAQWDSPIELSTIGKTHLIDMDASGQYLYIAGLIQATSEPIIIMLKWDLTGAREIYNPSAGTWGGIFCDPFYPSRVWLFGDFGAATKVLMSEDWGDSFTNVTDAGWGAAEVVRPLLISEWSSRDVIAILNDALQAHQSKDDGETWTNNGAINFAAQCGCRDPLEPFNIWIGRDAAGANHIQYSPNEGDDWLEWSTDFEPNAPVTALQVIG